MNEQWKKISAVIQKGDNKLADIVYGRLTDTQKDMIDYHMYHSTPYYCTSMKENPYGHKSERGGKHGSLRGKT